MEKLYIDRLAEIGKSIDSHITRFAAKIVNADIGLTDVQSTSGCKYQAFRTSRIAAVIPDAEWCQMLRKVAEPIREEIFQVHKMEKSSMSALSLELLSLQYKKLGFLITYLCHGKPDANYLLLNLDTICQQIVLNTNKRPPSSKSKIICRSSDKGCRGTHYTIIKLYDVIRFKLLVHVLFERDMVSSYHRILTFINELSETVKALYNDSGETKCCHLPCVEESSLYSSMTMLIKTARLSLLLATSMGQELLSYSFLLKKSRYTT